MLTIRQCVITLAVLWAGVLGSPDLAAAQTAKDQQARQPWLGVHAIAGTDDAARELIDEVPELAKVGVNVLIIEVGFGFEFKKHPELRAPAFVTAKTAAKLAETCRKNGIRPIPCLNCVGHQSGGKRTLPLLAKYPEFDETPGKYPKNEGIYARSWCVQHPKVNAVAFSLIDDLIDAFGADAFHAGLDEVMLIGSEHCARCKGHDPAELYAKAVRDIHAHIVGRRKVEMLMWGDRLLDAKTTGYGKWEASAGGTHGAVDKIPKDIIICDWHYETFKSYPSLPLFLEKGFRVWPAGWKQAKPNAAFVAAAKRHAIDARGKGRVVGYLATTWGVKIKTLAKWDQIRQPFAQWNSKGGTPRSKTDAP